MRSAETTSAVERTGLIADYASEFASLGLMTEAAPLLETVSTGLQDTVRAPNVVEYDASLDPAARHRQGVHYTPTSIARGLTERTLDRLDGACIIGDPACGAGVFLVAAADVLHDRGVPVATIIRECLFGADLDPVAVQITRLELALWAARRTGRFVTVPEDHLIVADGLETESDGRWVAENGVLDVVLGNPPFGSQLKGDTVRATATRQSLAGRLGIGNVGYADTAALFLLRAVEMVRRGGMVSLVLPASVAANSGCAKIRETVAGRARLVGVWEGGTDVGFAAAVRVWAPTLAVGSETDVTAGESAVRRFVGPSVEPAGEVVLGPNPENWAPLLGDAPGLPPDVFGVLGRSMQNPHSCLTSVANVTAGFRQHFYGLVDHVLDDPDNATPWPVLVTTGAVDPLRHRVDEPVRFAGRRWLRPVVDMASLDRGAPTIAAWVRELLVPKVLVASQGRVLEVVVDADGTMVPSTPAIAVVPHAACAVSPWHVAAALCSPWETLRLHHEAAGTGLASGTCRVTARFVGAVQLPADRVQWDRAARSVRDASEAAARGDADAWADQLDAVAQLLVSAGRPEDLSVGTETDDAVDELSRWFREQRPPWRCARTLSR